MDQPPQSRERISRPEIRITERLRGRVAIFGGVTFVLATALVTVYWLGAGSRSPVGTLTAGHQSMFSSLEDGKWVVSSDPGPNVPPIGRSLFDFLTMIDDGNGQKHQVIPYPFSQLVASIRARTMSETLTPGFGLKNVLIPLGRSLQRSASAPDFFRFPRAVVGVDGFPQQTASGTGMLMRDRLFVGYNEKAAVLEIISYNESAGRFEYQVAHDYKEGGTPHVLYANRNVCLSCHQNATPIFSDRPWQETNFNAEVTHHLAADLSSAPAAVFDGQRYMGIPISVPESQPQGLDNAKFRANLLPATHFIWQQLCAGVDGTVGGAARCRGQALGLALRMGFSNQLDETTALFAMRDTSDFLLSLTTNWQRMWPSGLLISSPRIPNRNPFEQPRNPGPFDVTALRPDVAGALGDLIKTSNIPAEFEPLNHRAALDNWHVATTSADGSGPDLSGLANWLRQMVGFFTQADWNQLDQWASAQALKAGSSAAQITGACDVNTFSVAKLSLNCEGSGSLDPLRLAGFISWDTSGHASGGFETLAVRSDSACELTQGADQAACPEADNLVLSGDVTMTADGVYQATLTAKNQINHLRTRFSDGNLLDSLSLRWKAGTQVAVAVSVLHDFSYLSQAIAQAAQDTGLGQADVLAKRPFRRTAILTYLRAALGGVKRDPADCCEADTGMPPAQEDAGVTAADAQLASIAGPAAPFIKECSICHRNQGGFPPNYLTGSITEIQSQLSLCAERIWYRVNMYTLDAHQRGQSPMPPMSRLTSLGFSEAQWRSSDSFQSVRAAAADLLRKKGIEPPDPATMNYKSLPQCFGNSF